MPADASPDLSRRAFLRLGDESAGHISSLVVQAHPARVDAVADEIARLSDAEVTVSAPASGKLVVILQTRDEDGIVTAMNAMQRIEGVVNVALVYHQIDT